MYSPVNQKQVHIVSYPWAKSKTAEKNDTKAQRRLSIFLPAIAEKLEKNRPFKSKSFRTPSWFSKKPNLNLEKFHKAV